jgi:hypothetical protein
MEPNKVNQVKCESSIFRGKRRRKNCRGETARITKRGPERSRRKERTCVIRIEKVPKEGYQFDGANRRDN